MFYTLGLRLGNIRGAIKGGTGLGRRVAMRCGCSPGIVKEEDNFVSVCWPNRGTRQLGVIRKECGKECWSN